MYIKVLYDHMVIDIIHNPTWVMWLSKSGKFILSDIVSANGVVSSNSSEVYNISNRGAFVNHNDIYKSVDVIEIIESEYNAIKAQIVEKPVDADGNTVSLQDAIKNKIEALSAVCEKTITDGFDIILSDGVQHHFDLELADQLKISKLNDRAKSGEEFLPYHAKNEPCKIYSADDIIAINTVMESIIEYQTTYFNSLKMYVGNMTDTNEVLGVTYGIDIPEGFRSEVLQLMMQSSIGESDEGMA